MRSSIPDKLNAIIDELDAHGHASLDRLTVLKPWFEHPRRLSAFGLWIARRAAARKGKTKGEAGALLDEARALLGTASTRESVFLRIDPVAALDLHRRAAAFQNGFHDSGFGPDRIITCWPLFLVEAGLQAHVGPKDEPGHHGLVLCINWTQNYDTRHGLGLHGPSRGKLDELLRFLFRVEALEETE